MKGYAMKHRWVMFVLFVFSLSMMPTLTLAQTATPDPDEELPPAPVFTSDDFTLTIERIQFSDEIGSFEPIPELFEVYVIIWAQLENTANRERCVRARQVRLYLNGDSHAPQNHLMDEVKAELDNEQNFIGAYDGHCLDAGERESTFVVFETELGADNGALSFFGDRQTILVDFPNTIEAALTTVIEFEVDEQLSPTVTSTPSTVAVATVSTPRPTSTPEPEDVAREIIDNTVIGEIVTLNVNPMVPAIVTRYEMPQGFSGYNIRVTHSEMVSVVCNLRDDFAGYRIIIDAVIDVVDGFGNVSSRSGVTVTFEPDTVDAINCDNVYSVNVPAIADDYFIDRLLQ